ELLCPGMYYWTGPDRVAYLVAPAGTFVLPGVISTPGQPIIKTRRVAIASMRANARAMPTRRHQVRPTAGQPPPRTSPGTGSGTDPGLDAEPPVSNAGVPASPGTTSRPIDTDSSNSTDPPPF
ncbi:hypothetical protein, partial [Ruania rhizosphaerae]|uniref:hypothetical protein n=1 Tax=Ruania rhizosphaerae TaxID=1840413 RepID=UPI001F2FC09E